MSEFDVTRHYSYPHLQLRNPVYKSLIEIKGSPWASTITEVMAAARQVSARWLIPLVSVSSLVLSVLAIPLANWKLLATIKELNQKGPYLGLVTVYSPEEEAFFANGAFKPDRKHPYVDLSGRRFRIGKVEGRKIIYVRCGVGLVNAAAATQQMLDVFDILGILHFGISGNLNNSQNIGDVLIPKSFAQTGLWDWLKPNTTIDSTDVAELDIGNYNVPKEGYNLLGVIGYSTERFYSESGKPNTPERTMWFPVTETWFDSSSSLEGLELQQCVNSSLCLPQKPKVVRGLNGTTSDSFIDNAAYRNFLFSTFHVSSTDMESAAVVMTSLSNGFPILVIRGLSDLAGAQSGNNSITIFGPLAATNVAKAVVQFVKTFQGGSPPLFI